MSDSGGCNRKNSFARSLTVACEETEGTHESSFPGKWGTRFARTTSSENAQSHRSTPRQEESRRSPVVGDSPPGIPTHPTETGFIRDYTLRLLPAKPLSPNLRAQWSPAHLMVPPKPTLLLSAIHGDASVGTLRTAERASLRWHEDLVRELV